MEFATIEDKQSKAEIVIFPRLYAKVQAWLEDYTVFVVQGTQDRASTQLCKIKAQQMVPAELFFEHWKDFRALCMEFDKPTTKTLQSIKELLPRGRTPLHIIFKENDISLRIRTQQRITINQDVINSIEKQANSLKIEL